MRGGAFSHRVRPPFNTRSCSREGGKSAAAEKTCGLEIRLRRSVAARERVYPKNKLEERGRKTTQHGEKRSMEM